MHSSSAITASLRQLQALLKCAMYRLYRDRSACSLHPNQSSAFVANHVPSNPKPDAHWANTVKCVALWKALSAYACIRRCNRDRRKAEETVRHAAHVVQVLVAAVQLQPCVRQRYTRWKSELSYKIRPTCRAAACQNHPFPAARAATARTGAAAAGGNQTPAAQK